MEDSGERIEVCNFPEFVIFNCHSVWYLRPCWGKLFQCRNTYSCDLLLSEPFMYVFIYLLRLKPVERVFVCWCFVILTCYGARVDLHSQGVDLTLANWLNLAKNKEEMEKPTPGVSAAAKLNTLTTLKLRPWPRFVSSTILTNHQNLASTSPTHVYTKTCSKCPQASKTVGWQQI